jgi:site-specific recombinase XerD
MTELRRRMIQDMELRGLKENTQKAYVDAVKDLARHYNRPPDLLSEEELRRYFVYLTKGRRCSESTLRVRLFGIKFLLRYTLRRPMPVFDLIRLSRERKLPTVLSRLYTSPLPPPSPACDLGR